METAAETVFRLDWGLVSSALFPMASHRGLHSHAAPRLITIALYRCVAQTS